MPLSAGTKLGPYEILAPIGAGGMGEVYRARDPRLGRDVAIKVSSEQFTERFEREARAIAALNHPNICHLYDVGPNYLVMELIDGERLQGPVAVETALEYARQIADALEAAHERGIIHRDLKPANIMIAAGGVIKVLDFGLAKNADAPAGDPQSSPTMTISPTRAGMILGTAAYMSPEQARGKNVDKRADIWAFGVVLYEVLTGKQLFHGETVSDILAGVLKEEPNLDRVPLQVNRLLRRCLEKDPKKRLRDIGDWTLLLQDAPKEGRRASRALPWIAAAAALALGLAAVSFLHFRETPPAAPAPTRFQILPPENTEFGTQMALSPDGRLLAFTALSPSEGSDSIWVRPLDALQARPLRLARTAMPFFWSPDSRFIAYNGNGKLTKIDVSGGPPQVLCDAPLGVIGGFWTEDGTIVFGQTPGGLMSVPASGGVPNPLGTFNPSGNAIGQILPALLPDGRHFLYYTNVEHNTGIVLTSFGAKPASEKFLVDTPKGAAFAPWPNSTLGHLLFLRENTLMAQPLDLAKLAMAGTAVPVAEGVGTSLAHGFFSVSNNGVLAYRTGSGGSTQLAWVDRTGKEIGSVGPPGDYRALALSPDGARVATARVEARNTDIWVFDVARNTNTRLTSDPASDEAPVWSRDGSRIAWTAGTTLSGNQRGIFMTPAAGDAKPQMLVPPAAGMFAWDWSEDGRLVLYSAADPKTRKIHLWTVTVDDEKKREPITQTQFNELQPQVSPGGRWISYMSDESGRYEIYVRPFSESSQQGGKIKVSEGGGTEARWRRDGKELFYLSDQTKMMAVEVSTTPSFKAGVPHPLFQTRIHRGSGFQWDVSPDGKRFLFATVATEKSDAITIVTNWQATLKK
jgi:Tol biopolymer transport system component